MPSPGSRLRAAWREGCLVVPGVPDALVARMAEEAGFRCLYVSGAATANGTLGLPDIGLVTATEMADWAGRIARAVEVPVIADADTGYGNAINVMRTVDLFERAGLAGMHLEDQVFPKRCGHVAGKRVIPVEEMVGKIRAACRARSDPGFVIIARTDARDVEGLEAAISRGKAYLDAGADALFPEALRSEEEFARFADAFPGAVLMANVTEFGKTPLLPATVLERLGYRLVLYPLSALRVMLKAAREFLVHLRATGSQAAYLDRMLTRAELYELVRYARFTGWEREFLPEGGVDPLDRGEGGW